MRLLIAIIPQNQAFVLMLINQ